MHAVAWVVALFALLLALGLIFLSPVIPLTHDTAGVGIGLVAAAVLFALPFPVRRP